MGQELGSTPNETFSADDSSAFSNIEPTLMKLNDFIHSKVKLTDFTAQDKQNLVELFVTHQKTLKSVYLAAFP